MTDFILATISVTLAVAWISRYIEHPVIAIVLWLTAQAVVIWYWWFTSP
jgi:hypothetical protein